MQDRKREGKKLSLFRTFSLGIINLPSNFCSKMCWSIHCVEETVNLLRIRYEINQTQSGNQRRPSQSTT